MIIPAEALPKAILISTLISELFLVAIPLLILLAYRQKQGIPLRSLWLGMGLALISCIKFLFLMKQPLFSSWEPLYSISIIVIIEMLIREWILRHWSNWTSRSIGIQFVMGYLFAKLLAIGTSVFLFFTWMLARISYTGKQGPLNTEAFQQLTPYTQLILHSLFNLGYMMLLFVFIMLRIRLINATRKQTMYIEMAFLFLQGLLLFLINNPSLPAIPLIVFVFAGTLGIGYAAYTLLDESIRKHSDTP